MSIDNQCKHPSVWEISGENLCPRCGKSFSENELNLLGVLDLRRMEQIKGTGDHHVKE